MDNRLSNRLSNNIQTLIQTLIQHQHPTSNIQTPNACLSNNIQIPNSKRFINNCCVCVHRPTHSRKKLSSLSTVSVTVGQSCSLAVFNVKNMTVRTTGVRIVGDPAWLARDAAAGASPAHTHAPTYIMHTDKHTHTNKHTHACVGEAFEFGCGTYG